MELTKKLLKKELDKVCRELTLQAGRCCHCGNTKDLEDAHIIHRNNLAVRWDMDNHLCLCKESHRWAHRNPEEFDWWVKHQYVGLFRYGNLLQRANKIKKWTTEEMLTYLSELKKKLKITLRKDVFVEV